MDHRPHGWETERIAAQSVRQHKESMQLALLKTYTDEVMGLTDDAAAKKAGLLDTCYWKRCGELRQLKYLDVALVDRHDGKKPAPMTRLGLSGRPRIICWITDEGEAWLKEKTSG